MSATIDAFEVTDQHGEVFHYRRTEATWKQLLDLHGAPISIRYLTIAEREYLIATGEIQPSPFEPMFNAAREMAEALAQAFRQPYYDDDNYHPGTYVRRIK